MNLKEWSQCHRFFPLLCVFFHLLQNSSKIYLKSEAKQPSPSLCLSFSFLSSSFSSSLFPSHHSYAFSPSVQHLNANPLNEIFVKIKPSKSSSERFIRFPCFLVLPSSSFVSTSIAVDVEGTPDISTGISVKSK